MLGFAAPIVGLGFGSSTAGTVDRTTTGTSKLQASPASIMAYYIINELEKMTDPSDGDDWPLYVSHLPDNKNIKTDAGAIYDTAGTSDIRSMTGENYEHPGIQIRIRSRDYETGFVKIEDVANTLDTIAWADVEIEDLEYRIYNVSRTSPIVSLGVEIGTTRKFHFTINFLLTIRELTS